MYFIIYGFFYLLSLLPFRVIYFISDGIFVLLYHVFGYRKKVVMKNLQIAFPEKTEEERKKIAREFYHNLADSFMEAVKMISISKKQMDKKATGSYELINRLLKEGKSINLLCGHQFHWEYGNLLYSSELQAPFVTVYLPIENKALDKIIYNIRTKFGARLINSVKFSSKMHHIFNQPHVLLLAADQSPENLRSGYWVNFFSRPTFFFIGPEKSAVIKKAAVVFLNIKRLKRGHYHFECVLLTEDASQTGEPGQITGLYSEALQKAINEDPANYLWSHRRFKLQWKPEYGEVKA